MKIKVGINGMGRIGRMIIRSIIESNNKNIEIKHINNRTNSEASCALLRYDSIHGKFNAELGFDGKHLIINKNKILNETELVVSIEASETDYWKKYTGLNGLNFGINDFGKSAPYKEIYKHFKLSTEDIIKEIRKKL